MSCLSLAPMFFVRFAPLLAAALHNWRSTPAEAATAPAARSTRRVVFFRRVVFESPDLKYADNKLRHTQYTRK